MAAKIFMTEYGDVRNGMAYGAPLRTQVATASGTSAALTVGEHTAAIRVTVDGIISFNIDAAATLDDGRMPADQIEYFLVEAGHTFNYITNT